MPQMSTAALLPGWDPSYSMQLLPVLLPGSEEESWRPPVPLSHSASGKGSSLILFLPRVIGFTSKTASWFNLWSNL